jgi:DNA repair exonuclease SbcCD nuclease subunit
MRGVKPSLPPKKKIRLIHTSDTHLGGAWRPGLSEAVLSTIVAGVSQLGGDALLMVGDVFDHARVPDLVLGFSSSRWVVWAFRR